MTETITKDEIIETTAPEAATVKPYTFRKLAAQDIVPMTAIIKKIGYTELRGFFENGGLDNLLAVVKKDNDKDNEKSIESVGISVVLEVVDVVFGNLPKCESDIFQLLSQTSNLTVEEVKGLDLAVFGEMIIDFVKKEEFKDFIKVVSKLFK